MWEGETGWHDLVYALASHEANERAEQMKGMRGKAGVKVIKTTQAKNKAAWPDGFTEKMQVIMGYK